MPVLPRIEKTARFIPFCLGFAKFAAHLFESAAGAGDRFVQTIPLAGEAGPIPSSDSIACRVSSCSTGGVVVIRKSFRSL